MSDSYPTAKQTTDQMGLGRTQGQRGAEILAGLRAELMPSPESSALCRFSGRVTARIVLGLVKDRRLLNFVPVRLGGMTELTKRYLPDDPQNALIVDIAAGFAPRGFQLAKALPDTQIIEIDLPDVVDEKQKRLNKHFDLPANLHWKSADLGVTPLKDVLENQQADVIIAEGLVAYFALEEFTRITRNILACLKSGGVFICDVPWKPGMDEIKDAGRFFSRFAGNFIGVAHDETEARATLENSGASEVIVYHPEPLAVELNLPNPVFEPSLFVVARNGAEKQKED